MGNLAERPRLRHTAIGALCFVCAIASFPAGDPIMGFLYVIPGSISFLAAARSPRYAVEGDAGEDEHPAGRAWGARREPEPTEKGANRR